MKSAHAKGKRPVTALLDDNILITRAFAALPDAILVVDPNTHVVLTCNPAVSKIFGYRPDEVAGSTTEILHVNLDGLKEQGLLIEQALETLGSFHGEYKMKRRNGEIFSADVSVSEIRGQKGNRLAMVCVVRDVTERKFSEQGGEDFSRESKMDFAKIGGAKGLLSICANCKNIKAENGGWERMEKYFEDRWEIKFTHGICPACVQKLYPEYFPRSYAP